MPCVPCYRLTPPCAASPQNEQPREHRLHGVPRKGRLTAFTCKNSASPREEQPQRSPGGFLPYGGAIVGDGRPDPGIDDPWLAEDCAFRAWGRWNVGITQASDFPQVFPTPQRHQTRLSQAADRHVQGGTQEKWKKELAAAFPPEANDRDPSPGLGAAALASPRAPESRRRQGWMS